MNNVCLIEHPDDKADYRLFRLCEWAGYDLAHFGRSDLDNWPIASATAAVMVPLGPRAFSATGFFGRIDHARGYIWERNGQRFIPTYSPAYIQKGNAKYSAAFINDLQKAVELARGGMPPQVLDYTLDPTPMEALRWALEYRDALLVDPSIYLAFDIETPGKGDDEEDADTDPDAPDRTWNIERVGFSYRPLEAISVPWAPEYRAAVSLLLGSDGDKVVWNAGFDVPRLRRAGIDIRGTIHDGMVAWHILHSDLPKRLSFVATFTCPWQPAWKHLSGSKPAFYNATDADVELRSMLKIEEELKRANLWSVYQRDVVELEPILVHMHHVGMPVDLGVRHDRAVKLAERLASTKAELESCFPLETRKVAHVYKSTPADTTGLLCRPGLRQIPVCDHCGANKPAKAHFKRYVKKQNPCADRQTRLVEVEVDEYYRLAEFSPSRDQLVRYHQLLNRPLPMVWDKQKHCKKVSFGEKQIKELILKYKNDKIYPLILEYRSLDKIAGTYIGRPADD
jgi:hypothetical protein